MIRKNKAQISERLLSLVDAAWMTQAVYVAAELRVADLLADGPRKPRSLSAATGVHESSLRRLLRALVTLDVCREKDGAFEMTRMGALLRSDHPNSLRATALWRGGTHWPLWGKLLQCVKTGKSARKLLLGTTGFDHLKRDPRAAAVFHRAMVELTRLTTPDIVRAYDFSRSKLIVDVGGGCGQLLAAILRANRQAKGYVYDLPTVSRGLKRQFAEFGLGARCQFKAGDFFRSVPAGADVYVLKNVIHDWDDESALRILVNCRRAMRAHARLLVVERIFPARPRALAEHRAAARSDLTMLVALGAQERTKTEFRKLLKTAGLRVMRVIPTGPSFHIIEVRTMR